MDVSRLNTSSIVNYKYPLTGPHWTCRFPFCHAHLHRPRTLPSSTTRDTPRLKSTINNRPSTIHHQPSMMTTMKALVVDGQGSANVQDVDNLPVRDTYVKIKVHAIALNPTDYKHIFSSELNKGGEVTGCDSAGEVVAIGSRVTSNVKIGDRIAGLTHGSNSYSPRDGCWAEYAEIKDGIFAHLPDSWTWAEGSTLGAGVTTAGQGLFYSLKLPPPGSASTNPKTSVLIYGGSTATGCLAIQYARAANLHTIVLASSYQFARMKALGADVCYDYHEDGIGARIREDTDDRLLYAFDILSNDYSMKICAEALASGPINGQKPRCTLLLPGATFPRHDVETGKTSGYSIIGETSITYGKVVEGDTEQYEWGRKFWAATEQMMKEGRFRPHDIEVRDGGLAKVVSGLEDLRDGKIRGKKLVYVL